MRQLLNKNQSCFATFVRNTSRQKPIKGPFQKFDINPKFEKQQYF